MADEYAIDKIIPNRDENYNSNEDIGYSNSFNLSMHDQNFDSIESCRSDVHRSVPNRELEIPGLENLNIQDNN